MGVNIDEIKDPKLRARYQEAARLGTGGGRERPANSRDGKVDTRSVGATDPRTPERCCSTQPARPLRLRQSHKPVLNKLEQQWFDILKASHWMDNLRAQSRRYKLCNGCWYKPDVTGNDTRDGRETAYEVKGPHAFRGGFEFLKMAAHEWPEVRWILVWRQFGEWQQQTIIP